MTMHHRAKLTEHEVELIRQLVDERRAGMPGALRFVDIAEKFEVHITTVERIANFRRRLGLPRDKPTPRRSMPLTAARCRELRLAFFNSLEHNAVSDTARRLGVHPATLSWLLRNEHPAERRERLGQR